MKNFSLLFFWSLIFFIHPQLIFAQVQLNQKPLNVDKNNYSFLTLGHLYGNPSTNSPYPAGTFLANRDHLAGLKPNFLILLGDVVRSSTELQVKNFDQALAEFNFPIFNTPGNHELSADKYYFDRYSDTTQSFPIGQDLFLLIDTGADSQLSENSHRLIINALEKIDPQTKRIFIFSHRLFWLNQQPALEKLTGKTNNGQYYDADKKLSDLIRQLTVNKNLPVYYFAGDIGVREIPSILYYQNQNSTYVATGIGDTGKDFAVLVKVNSDNVEFETIPLSGQPPQNIDSFGPEHWQTVFVQTEGLTAPPSLTIAQRLKALPTKLSFWAGIAMGGLVFTLFYLVRKIILLLFQHMNP